MSDRCPAPTIQIAAASFHRYRPPSDPIRVDLEPGVRSKYAVLSLISHSSFSSTSRKYHRLLVSRTSTRPSLVRCHQFLPSRHSPSLTVYGSLRGRSAALAALFQHHLWPTGLLGCVFPPNLGAETFLKPTRPYLPRSVFLLRLWVPTSTLPVQVRTISGAGLPT